MTAEVELEVANETIACLERELAEAREQLQLANDGRGQLEGWRDDLEQKLFSTRESLANVTESHCNLVHRAEAAEARLAAVARVRNEMNECCRWEDDAPAVNVRQLKKWVAALSAPAEPKASTWCPDDASPSNPNLRGKP